MTKQEEIREGIAGCMESECDGCEMQEECEWDGTLLPTYYCPMDYKRADFALSYLDSRGVVLKGSILGASHPHLVNYYTVEPLIGG